MWSISQKVVSLYKISRKCEFQPIKSLEITRTTTLTINLRFTTFCEIDPWTPTIVKSGVQNERRVLNHTNRSGNKNKNHK
jgi:hypothetical protein